MISNRSMSSFDRTILMGGVRTGRVNSVVELGEKIADRGIPEEFTALVHVNVLILAVNSGGVL